MKDILIHYGTPRHSGRYPWGSGKEPHQAGKTFLNYCNDLKKQGLSEVEIADLMGMNTGQLRAQQSLAKNATIAAERAEALRLKDSGMSNVAAAKQMGISEATFRNRIDPALSERQSLTDNVSVMLKNEVAAKKYLDIGSGSEHELGITKTRLKNAVSLLEAQGYQTHRIKVEQAGIPGQYTDIKVLTEPGTTWKETNQNRSQIKTISYSSDDNGRSFQGLKPPLDISLDRVTIAYKEDGGELKDGVIELRRGVEDISLGNAKYAQVRISVEGTHYLKGMAVYSDDLPPGIDIRFNTNKTDTGNKLDAMKSMKDNPDNPFGATVKQKLNENGDVVSALNIVYEEGDWEDWSKTISSQVLSKQHPALARQQLNKAYDEKAREYALLVELTNPVVKKQLLDAFADDCDSASVHLKAAALPRQATKVLLPIPSLKETEVYAPSYNNGETVVLIRHPHGGTFEIPQLIVNNKSKIARDIMGNAKDAVGIHPSVAKKLSGADFDGDTVIVIPNNKSGITSIQSEKTLLGRDTEAIKNLREFDPKISYAGYEGMTTIDGGVLTLVDGKLIKTHSVDKNGNEVPYKKLNMQNQMGKISNLITDMTIRGANLDEIAKAVKHSMVVIDSEKHYLNYKQSAIDNGIASLKSKYQGGATSGAATLISKASSEIGVSNRRTIIDPDTGSKTYLYPGDTYTTKSGEVKVFTGKTYVDYKGETQVNKIMSTRMAEVVDAFELSSGTPIEAVYATHANKLKALANSARKESIATITEKASPSAKEAYSEEVSRLKSALSLAQKNAPKERQAQLFVDMVVQAKKHDNPELEGDDLKKVKAQALTEGRIRTGAKKDRIDISDREWEAIQAGAVSPSMLKQILNNTDLDKVKKLATPRTIASLTSSEIAKARTMLDAGNTIAEVASSLGISTSTLTKAMA